MARTATIVRKMIIDDDLIAFVILDGSGAYHFSLSMATNQKVGDTGFLFLVNGDPKPFWYFVPKVVSQRRYLCLSH